MHPLATILTILGLFIPNLQTSPSIWLNYQQAVPAFPESLTFKAGFGGVEPITEVILIYGVDQDTCGSVDAISYPRFTSDRQVDVEWTWDMRQSGSLPPGARLWWQWKVTDQQGTVFTTEKQELIWLDAVHTWQEVESGQISLHYYYLDYAAALGLLDHAVFSLGQLTEEVGVTTSQPIDLYIYGSTEDMQQAILYEPGWTGGLAYPDHNIVLIGISPYEIEWGKSTIAHELTHLLVGDYAFSCLGSLPTWLQEGLAVLGEGGPDSNSIVQFEEARSKRTLISFQTLSGGFSEDLDKANLSYSQSYYMVKYLVDTYGQEEIRQLLKVISRGTELNSALQTVYGFSLDGFEERWRSSIGVPLEESSAAASIPTSTSTVIATIIPIQGIMPGQSTTPFPPSSTTQEITSSPTATGKPLPVDTRSLRFIFIACICLIGIVIVALLVVLLARKRRKSQIVTVLIFFLLVSGIPWLNVRGDQTNPTPYPPITTDKVYFPVNPKADEENHQAIHTQLQSGDIHTGDMSDFDRSEVLILEGGETGNPRENDPATSHSGSDNLVFSGLVTYNTRMELIPDLAERWEVSQDRMVYTFHLHPDASFHNGRPVTARDVIFSWERAADPEMGSDTVLTYLGDIVGVREMRAGQAGSISGVKALDDHTLQVTIDQPKPYFLQKLTYPTTYIVDKENVALGEEWYRTPNGTGPFRLSRWESMRQKIYERYDGFYGEKPKIKAILVNLYSGDSTRLYEMGAIDLTGIGPYDLDRFSDPSEPMHQELHSTPDLCTSYVTLDVTQPPFDNLKVRQAFAQAIDRDLYVQLVLKNGAIPARGLYPPALPGHDLSLKGWEYNPEKAKRLLEEAGMDPGKMPEIVFSSAGYGSNISSTDAALIQMWEQNLGVVIHARNIEPEYYLEHVLEGNAGQISREGWCADYPDPENFADVLYHSGAEMNTGGYSNPAVDAILEQARVEVNTTSRMALYQQAEQMIVEDVPAIFLSHSISYALVKPYVQGFVLAPMVIPFERYLWIDPSRLPNP